MNIMPKSKKNFFNRLPILTDPQLAAISEILRNLGLLILGLEILPYIFGSIDKPPLIVVLLSIGIAVNSWIIAILMIRKIKL